MFWGGYWQQREIKYSNMAGMKTIWFQNGKFADEKPEDATEKPWKTVCTLESVKSIL